MSPEGSKIVLTKETIWQLWRKMFGALGDVNVIGNPDMHTAVFECLDNITQMLLKVRIQADTIVYVFISLRIIKPLREFLSI